MELLKLFAMDQDDLEVVSTHLQDALVCVGDVHWRPAERRLALGFARFDWEGSLSSPQYQRRRTALRFERVNSLKCRNINCSDKTAMLNLLAVEFEEADAPAGVVILTFSGGGALRLEVECLECEMVDLGPVWETGACPRHADDATAGLS
jgi:Protein of unknown function (DUF2948)